MPLFSDKQIVSQIEELLKRQNRVNGVVAIPMREEEVFRGWHAI